MEPALLLLFVGPPLAGTAISAFLIRKAFAAASEEAGAQVPPQPIAPSARLRPLVFMMVPFTAVIFAFVSWVLFSYGNAGTAIARDIVISAGINMGLAGLFTALGQAAVGRSHAKDVLIDGKNFGRQLISIINCEAPILFSFIVAFISYAGSSSHSNIPLANLVMAAFSVTALAYGLLSARIPPKEFRRRLGLGAVPGYVAFAGLLVALHLLGMF